MEWNKDEHFTRLGKWFSGKPLYHNGDACWNIWECTVPALSGVFAEKNPFTIYVYFSDTYPNASPTVQFKYNWFHPNIGSDSFMQCPVIKNWSSDYTYDVLLYDVSLTLANPHVACSVNDNATQSYLFKKEEYERMVREQFNMRTDMELQMERDQLQQEEARAEEERQRSELEKDLTRVEGEQSGLQRQLSFTTQPSARDLRQRALRRRYGQCERGRADGRRQPCRKYTPRSKPM